MSALHVDSAFDGGNISVTRASSPQDIALSIAADPGGEHFQWFYYRVVGARGMPLRMRLVNAGAASYPFGWEGYQAVSSADRAEWRRVPTSYRAGELVIEDTPAENSVYYAYFAPYSGERHADLLARVQREPGFDVTVLGRSVEGRAIDSLRVGGPDAEKLPCWVLARQHPGETMGEWLVEGLIERLLEGDSVVRQLRERVVFYIVPNMNPDGSRRGHLRLNAAGENLNRVWQAPDAGRSPEVLAVRSAMAQTGVAVCLDVHGDEALPYNFMAGPDGVAGLPDHVLPLRDRYVEALCQVNPDFQREAGYPRVPSGRANLGLCTNYTAYAFGSLSMTLEQPFKDAANHPEPEHGWSPDRAQRLGASQVDALAAVLDDLYRAKRG